MGKMFTSIMLIASLIAISGCGSFVREIGDEELTPAGQRVNLTKNEPASGCVFVKDVSATAREFSSGASLSVRNRLRNEAGKVEANFVTIDTLTANGQDTVATLVGRAYKCPIDQQSSIGR
ncbi:MAG: DUF4156 domain-containing protein [Oligoflexia bacterium]|nr:DUF4156 domain-containing protein [Oligoflexia bacterium]